MKQNLLNSLWSRVCLLATIMMTALAGTAFAEEAVFDFTAITETINAGELSFREGEISITCSNGAVSLQSSTMQLRWYANQTLTIAADAGYEISAISITKGANDKGTISLAAGSTGTLGGGTGSGAGNVATWSGTASSVSFTTAGQSRVTNITVTYQSAGDTPVGPVPTITVTPTTVTLAATTTQGYQTESLDIEYSDIAIENYQSFTVQFYDAEGEEVDESEWLIVGVTGNNDEGYSVKCFAGDNEGEARTAYFKVYALDSDDNRVYSELITVTQEAYVEPATPAGWALTALADITPDDIFVIVADNGSTYAMSNDNGTQAAPAAVPVTVTDGTLSGDVPQRIQWQLSVGEDGYTFYPYGDAESWLYCTNTNNGVRVGTNANKVFTLNATSGYLVNSATSRYIGVYNSQDWRCYTSINDNIKGQTFKFYKKQEIPQPTSQTVAVSAAGYATFAALSNLVIPADMPVNIYTVKVNEEGYAELSDMGNIIPAGEPVLIKANEGEYTFQYTSEEAQTVYDNDLKVSTEDVVADGSQYILANDVEGIGFYMATPGSTIPSGKAFLHIQDGTGAKAFIGFLADSDATGIAENNFTISQSHNLTIFNLAGQRLGKMQRGINIVRGKKVLKK